MQDSDPAVGAIWTPIARDPGSPTAALRFYTTPRRNRRRVTLIGERFDLRQPCAEAATAMILATVMANRLRADLRLVTRTEPVQPNGLDLLLQAHGLSMQGESMFQWAPAHGSDAEFDRFDDELVLAASCASAAAALDAVPARDVVCLLQGDERLLHPVGDERLRCEALLQRQDLRFVVHTQALWAQLIQHGLPHFETGALSFEPAFPLPAIRHSPRLPADKRRFIFHAPAGEAGGLFRQGVAAIEQALAMGVLDLQRWDLVFIGRDMPEVGLAGGHRPGRLQDLEASAYARLLGEADLGLILCPPGASSRTPMEMAASGAVVVSNVRCSRGYGFSSNLIGCSTDLKSLVQGLQQAVGIVDDDAQRRARHVQTPWSRDWAQALHGVIETLAAQR